MHFEDRIKKWIAANRQNIKVESFLVGRHDVGVKMTFLPNGKFVEAGEYESKSFNQESALEALYKLVTKDKGKFTMQKRLQLLATRLPRIEYKSNSTMNLIVSGSTLIAKGTTHLHGKPVDPKMVYPLTPPTKFENHYKHLKKAYKDLGEKGVLDYMAKVERLALNKDIMSKGKGERVTVAKAIEYLELDCTEQSFKIRYLYGKDPKISSVKKGTKRFVYLSSLDDFIAKNEKIAKE